MTYAMLAIILAIAISWSGWAAHRLWIGPAVKRRRARRRVERLGIHAFMV